MNAAIATGVEVLVADDESAVCFALQRLLLKDGYVPHVVSNGKAALEIANARGRHLRAALLDVLMPRLTGLAVVEELKRVAPWVRCGLMTAHRFDVVVAPAIERSGVRVLDKPFGLTEVRSLLADLVREDDVTPPPRKSPLDRLASEIGKLGVRT